LTPLLRALLRALLHVAGAAVGGVSCFYVRAKTFYVPYCVSQAPPWAA
jgi:hypothetical protein